MPIYTDRELEAFVGVIDDADAWDLLARLGYRLVALEDGVETWVRPAQKLDHASA